MESTKQSRFAFTVSRIEKLEPREKLYLIYDSEVPQMVCRIYPSGAKAFELRTSFMDKPWSQKICDYNSAVNIGEVRKIAAQWLLKLQSGENPKREKQEFRECMTLGEVMAWYVDDAKARGLKSLYQVELIYKVHIEETLGKRKLLDIYTGDLSRLVRPLLAERKKTQTNRVVSFIGRLYNFAASQHSYRGDNPTKNWDYEMEKPSTKFMDKATFEKFIEAVKQTESDHWRDMYLLMSYTGCRVRNAYQMKFSEIDWSRCKWIIPGDKSKNADDMVIDLGPKLMGMLTERKNRRRGDYVFPQPKGGLTADRWHYRRAFDEICKRAGITGFYPHSIRKTLGAYMISVQKKSIYEAGKQLCHKKIATTERSYGKLFDEQKAQNSLDIENALP